jgi:cell division septation protein DedD
VAEESESEEEDWNGGLHMFPGLVTYWAGIKEEVQEDQKDEEDMMGLLSEGIHISDDEDDLVSARIGGDDFIPDKEEHLPSQSLVEVKPEENKSDLKNAKPDASRLYLGGLLGVYADDEVDNGSDTDDEDGPPVEVKTIKSVDSSFLPPPIAPPPVEIKSESVPTVQCSEPGKSRHRKRKPAAAKDAAEKSSQLPPPKVERPDVLCQPMRPPTLLEKLLLDEINRERNVVLQCVRYVCDKNFFLN